MEAELLGAILSASPDYVLAVDEQLHIVYLNRLSPPRANDDLIGTPIEVLVPEETRAEAIEVLRRAVDHGEPGSWTSRGTGEESERHYRVRVQPIEGVPKARALVQVQDTTDAVVTQRALEVSEERMKLAMTKGQVGFWELDLETRSGAMSSSLRATLGMNDGPITPQDILELTHPDDRERALVVLKAIGDGTMESFEREYRLRTVDGSYRWYVDRAVRTLGDRGQPVFTGTMVDVTALRAAEARERELREQLEQAQRLESLGLLAGGVAHDFNNLLMVIIASLDLALAGPHVDCDVDEDLEDAMTAAEQAAKLTRQLLAYGRRSPLQLVTLDATEVASEVIRMCERLLPATITVTHAASGSPTTIEADRQQLGQALLNLVINARDAMPDGGEVEVRVTGGEEVAIAVSDNGSGMDAATRARVFEPFFTTKQVGQGTGLGLAMVHGIVQQHCGAIEVDSELGRGTTVTLRFPAHVQRPDSEVPASGTRELARGRILLAEDEPQVRRLVTRILQTAGYEVIATADGAEAVDTFTADPEFDLLLLDVVMPRLDGWRAFEAIRRLDPDVPALFSTGYANDALPPGVDVPVMRKPYRRSSLLAAVGAILEPSKAG